MPSTNRFVRNETQRRYRLKHKAEVNRRKREDYKMNAESEKRRVKRYRRRRRAVEKHQAVLAAKGS